MIKGKKGMEMWMLVTLIICLILLLLVVAWYAGLNESIEGLFNKLGALL